VGKTQQHFKPVKSNNSCVQTQHLTDLRCCCVCPTPITLFHRMKMLCLYTTIVSFHRLKIGVGQTQQHLKPVKSNNSCVQTQQHLKPVKSNNTCVQTQQHLKPVKFVFVHNYCFISQA
jgi:hypothetical protein